MAEEHTNKAAEVESKDRGMFDFMGKKEEEPLPTPQGETIATEFQKFKIGGSKAEEEHKEGEKKHSLLGKLHRSGSSSSSSSDEEEGECGEEKKKKKKDKKGLKEKIGDDSAVPVEKSEEHPETPEKKGSIDKIKEKLPGQHKKDEEVTTTPSPPPTPAAKAAVEHQEEESKEKKGFLEKIKEKIPGYHSKTEDEKETTASH